MRLSFIEEFFSALQRAQHRRAVNNGHKRTSTRKPLDRTFDSRVKPLLKKFMSSTESDEVKRFVTNRTKDTIFWKDSLTRREQRIDITIRSSSRCR